MQPTPAGVLDPHEMLFVVPRKRFVPVYFPNENGVRELTLHVGQQEISFDEPDLFPWAEKLIEQDSFMAATATAWTPQPLEWPRVQTLLDSLIDAGILSRTPPKAAMPEPAESALHQKFLAFEKHRATVDGPRSWGDKPSAVLHEITGRTVDDAYIEAIVPVHRLAHIAVDREGRQVGELNTSPDILRLKVETEFKTCGYGGSRYRSKLPMNMTALRSMIAHWKPVLKATSLCREEFVRRYPQLPDGRWKLGEVYFAAWHILALPTLQLMRANDPVKTGDLDPVLSSLFRVIDGVRMIAGHMLDLYERPMFHDTLVDRKDILTAVEREDQYRTYHGVCAGPPAMIDELVATLMDGKPVEGRDEVQLGPWEADVPAALDYALYGVQIYASVMICWVRMGLAFTRIHEALQRSPELTSGRVGKLRQNVEAAWERILPGRNHTAEQRDFSEPFYHRMFWHAQRGLPTFDPATQKDLAVELEPKGVLGEPALRVARDVFASAEEREFAGAHGALLQEIGGYVLDYLRYERRVLGVITDVEAQIARLLGRAPPKAPFTGMQLGTALAVARTNNFRAQYYLLDIIEESLGVGVVNQRDATSLRLGDRTVDLH
ncbi:MAG TPA: hypothetical protein VGH20_02165 [Myxococcales bacterium]|jgi:hypothetical protein